MYVKKNLLILLAVAFMVCMPLAADDSGKSTVTINSAHRTEYYKEPETQDELISFTGEVSLKVVKNAQEIEIQAETVLYNRTRSTLYAEGDITFSRKSGNSASEKLTARTLLFNIDTLEGILTRDVSFRNSQTALIFLLARVCT